MVAHNIRPLAIREPSELTRVSSIDTFMPLDVYSGGLSDEAPRVESIATISAGYRSKGPDGQRGQPQRSTDGTIILHDEGGRAAGLAAALKKNGGKRLTIAFPFDDPHLFIQQRFTAYTATELQAYGDEHEITVLKNGGWQTYRAGTQEYDQAVQGKGVKVSVSVYFCLAEWGATGPEIIFPDGVGAYYRLRFTSRNSLRSILSTLRSIGQFSRGRIAGIPFDLAIDYREVAGSDGKKRKIPVWIISMRPPQAVRLTSGNFGAVMGQALAQGAALMLPSPVGETFDSAAHDGPTLDLDAIEVIDPTPTELETVAAGGTCDYQHWINHWHVAVHGSNYDNDDGRAAFLNAYSEGRTDSLSEFLRHATEEQASALIEAVKAEIEADHIEIPERPSVWSDALEEKWAAGVARAHEVGAVIPDKPNPTQHERADMVTALRTLAANISSRQARAELEATLVDAIERAAAAGGDLSPAKPIADLTDDEIRECIDLIEQALAATV